MGLNDHRIECNRGETIGVRGVLRVGQSVKTNPLREQLLFLRGLIANPLGVGAIAPSSPALARAVAAQVDPHSEGPVLELGPGTGAMTRELLARGISPDRMVAIEWDANFAKALAAEFCGVTVIGGDAFDLDGTLPKQGAQRFAAIVSGIPLLNHPAERRRALVDAAFRRLAPGAPLIQFSYGFRSPVKPSPEITVRLAAFVWKNLPPATVWVYRRRA
jgi:phosphatidylethanolamine/phosphatidyl-N-methylethanolamine N-methyltransferase